MKKAGDEFLWAVGVGKANVIDGLELGCTYEVREQNDRQSRL